MPTPLAGLKTMPTGVNKNEAIFNEAIVLMEALLYRGAASRSFTAPPAGSPSPANGTIYLLPEGSPTTTGDWSGQEGNLAVYYNGWRFIPPGEGLTVWIVDELQLVQYRSGVWVNINEFPAQTLAELTDVDFSGSPSPANGDTLTFNGTAWVAGAGAASLQGAFLSRSSDQSISSSTFTTITWDTEAHDDLGNYDIVASDGQIDILADGRYDLQFQWQTTTRTGSWHVYITRNGTDNTALIAYMTQNSSSSIIGAGSLVKLGIELTAGDVIRAVIWTSSATTFTAAQSNFTIRKVG